MVLRGDRDAAGGLPGADARRCPREGFVGANVTIPHKEAALALAGDASAAATEIGAANTLSFDGGEIRADNTDAPGLLAALPEPPSGKRALVLGAGGSARAVAWALAGPGRAAPRSGTAPPSARSSWRRPSRRRAPGPAARLAAVSAEQARAAGYDLIVNCTAVGMEGAGDPFAELPLDRERLGGGLVLVDLVYGGDETALIAEGRAPRRRAWSRAWRCWCARAPSRCASGPASSRPLDVMREAARSALDGPGCDAMADRR